MSDNLRQSIYNNFSVKETEELLSIWQTNNRREWSELAFEVLEGILRERVGSVPPQNEPVLEGQEEESDDLEDWEARLLDEKDQPEFYDTLEVLDLRDNIEKVAKAAVIIYILVNVVDSYSFQTLFLAGIPSMDELPTIAWNMFITIISTTLSIALIYFPLKALSHILRILMEMEFNSRR